MSERNRDDIERKTIGRIQTEGFDALVNALGPEDAVRFIQSLNPGRGDYTKDRKNYLQDITLNQIYQEILEMQRSI